MGLEDSLLLIEIFNSEPYIFDIIIKIKTTLTIDSNLIPFKKGDLISDYLLYIIAST